ncbi:hypothetical protein AHFPHNDE_00858 [Pseudomonas sp. MM227]|uniref:hypothetical protein n=1 Tax=unclassified Pseudomonas TaxID=196821 RepID=UPI001781DD6C|nr:MULTISPECIES: hypothetical protein [unclassified Pseudomonas]MBD8602308.1 hypothetical protein [Pseudomonas sp. CFBP 8771]MBD8622538.1 hypothetical protein [Pseudomonas sp. CFBP 13727]MBD8730653.1 hypothetical protein [Pseudomonas sp. CFBP 13710]MBD8828429.1 hypothetical protein [Pseudomonas sp. CFBP 13602]CAI3787201.1 hypothetical protein AHFPHNDE_00858 [Pseudomonas sp. MM227]
MTNITPTTTPLALPGNLLQNAEFEQGFTHWITDDKGDPANCTSSPPGAILVNQASIRQGVTIEARAKQYTFRMIALALNSSSKATQAVAEVGRVVIKENDIEVASFYLRTGAFVYELEHVTQPATTHLEVVISSEASTPVQFWSPSLVDDFPNPDELIKDSHFERPNTDWRGGGEWQHGGVQLANGQRVSQLVTRIEPGSHYVITYTVMPFINPIGEEENFAFGAISGSGGVPNTDITSSESIAPIPFTATQNTLSITLTGPRIRFGSFSLKKR